jgi:type I restriction enzyme S subunit
VSVVWREDQSDLDVGVAELKAAQKKLQQYRQSLLKAAVEGALTADWREARRQQGAPTETGAQLLARILTERRARWEARQLAKFKEQGNAPPKDWQRKYPEPVQPDVAELPALPDGWFYADLETFIESDKTGTKTGPFGSLLKKHEHRDSGIPVIGIENIAESGFKRGSKIHITSEKARELSDYDLIPGDIVISRSGTVGEVCVIPEDLGEARFSTNIMRVRLNREVMHPEFFCSLFRGSPFVLRQISTLCSGSTRDFLNTEILKSLTFSIPPLEEQIEILDAMRTKSDDIEVLDGAIRHSQLSSASQRQNTLRAAFAGKLVSQDPSDEPSSALLERIRAAAAQNVVNPKSLKAKKFAEA